MRGEMEPERAVDDVVALVAERNREEIDAEPERDPAKIALGFDDAVSDLVRAAKALGPEGVVVFSPDYAATATAAVCGLIGELLIHGHDLARSIDRPWDVDRDAALLVIYAAASALSLVFDEKAAVGEDIHVNIRPRGGEAHSIFVKDGRVWTRGGRARADAYMSADPFAYLLLAYGRTSPLSSVLRGQLLVWGRKPWVMVKLPKLFKNP
jgi:uncharacterized protein (TIGR03083 family)